MRASCAYQSWKPLVASSSAAATPARPAAEIDAEAVDQRHTCHAGPQREETQRKIVVTCPRQPEMQQEKVAGQVLDRQLRQHLRQAAARRVAG
jgi:hypothetical protein